MTLPTITPLPAAPNRATDNPETFSTKADAFAGALPTFADEMNDLGEAIIVQNSAANYNSESTDSVAIGTGSKTFTVDSGKLYVAGGYVQIASEANVANFMSGQVTSYDTTTGELVVNVSKTGGAGTFADWIVTLSGPEGAEGPAGGSGTFVEKSGDTMTGPLATMASDSDNVPLTITPGAAPSAPSNGGFWATATGFFGRIGGTTYEWLAKAGGTMTGALGLFAGSTIQDEAGTDQDIGFRGIPMDIQSGSITLALKHAGAGVKSTNTGATAITIPPNSTVAFAANDTVIPLVNLGTTPLTITQGSGVTLYWSPSGQTGNRTLAAYGIATLIKTGTDTWLVSGSGLS